MKWDWEIDEEMKYENLKGKLNEDKCTTPYVKEIYNSYDSKDIIDSIILLSFLFQTVFVITCPSLFYCHGTFEV